MKDRIQKIITHEKLTPARFADIIGVQRSSVSHILSGRNNPGLDFLNKILTHFPGISGDWLITGNGNMLKKPNITIKSSSLFPESDGIDTQSSSLGSMEPNCSLTEQTGSKNELHTILPDKQPDVSGLSDKEPPKEILNPPSETEKSIDRVIVFYSDRTFIDYRPR